MDDAVPAYIDAGFTDRHPELLSSKGTIKLRAGDADALGDDELRDLFRAALGGPPGG
jgi:hypothetical protein